MQLAGIATGTYDDGKEAPGGLCLNTLDTEIQTAYEMKCELGREGILRSNNLDVNSPSAGGEPREKGWQRTPPSEQFVTDVTAGGLG